MLLGTIVAVSMVVLFPGAASAGGGCHEGVTSNDATGEKDVTVRMVGGCFTATVTTVDPGMPVTFVNTTKGLTHNVGGNQWGYFDDMLEGDSFTVTFDEVGIFPFACTYHPGMTGAIVVGDGKGAGMGEAISVEPFAPAPEAVAPVASGATGVPPIALIAVGLVGAGFGAAATSALRAARRRP
jgi:plastocyanin